MGFRTLQGSNIVILAEKFFSGNTTTENEKARAAKRGPDEDVIAQDSWFPS
jgi:hypothetical protein